MEKQSPFRFMSNIDDAKKQSFLKLKEVIPVKSVGVSKDVYVEGEAPEPDKTDANRHSKT